ncbi:MAG: 4Fe-4S dicluster domain-containing protein [Planctomycetota bacterium]|nr:MAG: 4Fe-4S dicluster domain-containing protein [Planctomycetota bacterium]
MSPLNRHRPESGYWRSLEQLAATPEYQELAAREFPDGGGEVEWTESTRRRFLQLVGASVALAGASACYWQKEMIAPFRDRPEGRVPGIPRRFATAMELGGWAAGLVVTSYDGRPVKVEGNPDHPGSAGATNAFAQAATLELYDPDRARAVLRAGGDGAVEETDWAAFDQWAERHFAGLAGRGQALAVVAEASHSPSLERLRARFAERFPGALWATWEPVNRDEETAGCALAFGRPLRPVNHFELASVVLSLDGDPLLDHPDAVRQARGFAARRRPEGEMSRVYAVESRYTTTGAAADHRLPLRSEQVEPFLLDLEAVLAEEHGLEVPGGVHGRNLGGDRVHDFLAALAEDLAAHRGAGLITVGPGQPARVHARAQRLNALLGNTGRTVEYLPAAAPIGVNGLRQVVAGLNAGAIETVVVLGGNPVYDAPADLDFAGAYAKAGERIHLSLYRNETSRASTWQLPRAHFLEAWGDCRSWDGTVSLRQPLIDPLYGGRSELELLARLVGAEAVDGRTIVRRTHGRASDADWRGWLHDGLIAGSRPAPETVRAGELPPPALAPEQLRDRLGNGELELTFHADSTLYDGRFANSSWLQELPDPLTTLTWDNALLVAVGTAAELGVAHGDLVDLRVGEVELRLPVYVMPGQAPGSLAVALGYGRTAAGHVGGLVEDEVAPVGFDAYRLRTSGALWRLGGAGLAPTGLKYELATVQDHHQIDTVGQKGRDERLAEVVRETDLAGFRREPDFARHLVHHPPAKSLFPQREYDHGHQWGMAIDLNQCTGCNACTIACQAENNIPVVGKEQVLVGREMHWIRIDRYFKGEADDPQVVNQPMACQHCEMAPCEEVCPAAATMHSAEGLNEMVYNRCIGTRYCSNNCPFKVRRFNFFNYNEELKGEENKVKWLGKNPEVTIRFRGVMEKCTFCVQRIAAARHDARVRGGEVGGNDVVTACQQVCPTGAIVFGDLNDPDSRVARIHATPRAYEMLTELNLHTRTRYLARVRNPHPRLAPAAAAGHGAAAEEVHHG